MMQNSKLDLSQVSDEDLKREFMRRFNQRRTRSGGRPRKLRLCPYCGGKFGAVELRVHKPVCESKPAAAAAPEASQGPRMAIAEARAKLQAHLGPHAWMSRAKNHTGYVYVSGLGPVELVSLSDNVATPARCLKLTLLHASMKGHSQ
jgi:hypothetical protein